MDLMKNIIILESNKIYPNKNKNKFIFKVCNSY